MVNGDDHREAGSGFKSFKDLEVWQVARLLVRDCYKLSAAFPPDERFGLTNQLRRSAVSVVSNIAEGQGRGSAKAFMNFLWIANGSLTELETQVLLAVDLEFVSTAQTQVVVDTIQQVGRMLTGLRRTVAKNLP